MGQNCQMGTCATCLNTEGVHVVNEGKDKEISEGIHGQKYDTVVETCPASPADVAALQAKTELPVQESPVPSQSKTPRSPEEAEAKKKELKVLISEFVSAASAGIPCTLYHVVDGVSTLKSAHVLSMDGDMRTIKLAPKKSPEKFHEVPLAAMHAFDYDRLKELRPEHKTLKVLTPAEQPFSVLIVSQQGETTCILVKDEAMKVRVVKSLQVLSAKAKHEAGQ